MLPAFECTQFANCNEFDGRCECPVGFGGDDCSEPVCGGLSDGKNRPIRKGKSCDCSDGWSGINCNMCTRDDVCNPFVPGDEPGTCYTGGILVKNNHQMCDVTNKKILDILKGQIPQVTFGCNKTSAECNFQFWVDERESFYCGLNNCEFDTEIKQDTNITRYQCPEINCKCIPGRMLCGEKGSIDISDFLTETIKGPGYFECDSKTGCKFSEPSMNNLIKSVFGDPHITLQCSSSECLHYTELPGYHVPENQVDKAFILATCGLAIIGLILGSYSLKYFIHLSQEKKLGFVSIPAEDETAKLMASHKPMSLQFQEVSYLDHGRVILDNAFGSVQPGQLMAIMGGSGAGKTTLLDILAAKTKRGVKSGEIFVNGKAYSTSEYRRVIGFVDQEDCLMPTLTVYETIVTSALLRLPKNMSEDAKRLRAVETMTELGILGIRDQIIGSESNRGISGGEKRRVAIACELVTSPSILFLDEPTSGLDSYNAYNVIECLVNLVKNYNRTVVFTIHQPRSNIVALFDQLVLLAQGKMVYSGPQAEAAQYFDSIGYPCPQGYNFADYVVDLTMKADEEETADQDEQQHDDNAMSTDNSSEIRSENTSDVTRLQRRRRRQSIGDVSLDRLVNTYRNSDMCHRVLSEITQTIETAHHRSEENTDQEEQRQQDSTLTGYEKISLFNQFRILSGRTFKNLYRNPMLMLTHYVIAVILGLFCGVLYFNVTNDISGFQNRLGLFFFLLALFGFSTLTTLTLFAEERIIFVRERANGYYKAIAYYCAKVLFDMVPLRVFPPIVLGVIIYPLVGLTTESGAFWKFILILVLFNLTAASTSLVIGILIQNTGVANLVGCLVMLFSLLFAGLFLNPDSMPPGTIWFEYLSIFHYAYEALAVNEVKYLTLTERKFGLSIEVPGATILSTFGFDSTALWQDIIGLVIFYLIFLIGGYLAMHFVLIERR